MLEVSPIFSLEVGPLPKWSRQLHPLVFTLMAVILFSSILELLRPISKATLWNRLGARSSDRVPTAVPSVRPLMEGALLSRLIVTRVPRDLTVLAILPVATRKSPSPVGLS